MMGYNAPMSRGFRGRKMVFPNVTKVNRHSPILWRGGRGGVGLSTRAMARLMVGASPRVHRARQSEEG